MTRERPRPNPVEVWRKYDEAEARLSAGLSERMLDLAGLRPGMRVLDLASGRGEPAIPAARRVAPTGSVLGVDPAQSMLEMARERAARENISNLELRVLNAETLGGVPRGHFHAATLRWGLMYMASPIAALTRAREALLPSGVFVAALWAEPERAPFYTFPRQLLEPYRAVPKIDPRAPGTFAYADPRRIAQDFSSAGLTIDHVEEVDMPVMEARSGAELIAWTRAFGLTPLLNELSEKDQQAWEDRLTNEAEKLRSGGVIRLGGVSRIVRARP